MNDDLPPPSPEEIAWTERMAALEDEAPFPGASGRAPRRRESPVMSPTVADATRRAVDAAPAIVGRFFEGFDSPEDCLQSAA